MSQQSRGRGPRPPNLTPRQPAPSSLYLSLCVVSRLLRAGFLDLSAPTPPPSVTPGLSQLRA